MSKITWHGAPSAREPHDLVCQGGRGSCKHTELLFAE